MAVYTEVPPDALTALLARYDLGTLLSAKGIAEGVENTNYLVDTTSRRLFLTLYEKRVAEGDLPFFLDLLDHLAARGLPVPRTYADRDGQRLQRLCGRPACLIEFLPGVSVVAPLSDQARAAGRILGRLHQQAADFPQRRPNSLGPSGWRELAARCGEALDNIQGGLRRRIADELTWLDAHWPAHLPHAIIHADLFPDNVLMLGDGVSGVIDFYFACWEVRAWDVAIAHCAWAFSKDGATYDPSLAHALLEGYEETHGLSPAEEDAFPTLARAACLRFLLTRAWDWIDTPPHALVTRKDPLAFLRRLEHYAAL